MAQPQSEVDAWRGAAGPLLEAMGLTPEQEQAAVGQLEPDAPAVAPQEVPEAVAPVEQDTAPEIPEIPDLAPVDLDDFEDLDPDDPDPADEPTVFADTTDDEYVDDETRKLRAELRKTQKALENERRQRVESNVSRWREKYKQMYPLADVESIKASSRREFERQAVLSHNKNYKILEPQLKALKEARDKIVGEARVEAKAEAQAAYGRPTTGPGAAPAIQGERDAAVAESRKRSKTFGEHLRNMLALEDAERVKQRG